MVAHFILFNIYAKRQQCKELFFLVSLEIYLQFSSIALQMEVAAAVAAAAVESIFSFKLVQYLFRLFF